MDKYKLTKTERNFLQEFSNELFGPDLEFDEFVKTFEKNSGKLFLDTIIFIVHPRVNRYGIKFILSEGLDVLIKDFREEFQELTGKFHSKLDKKEKLKFDEYWSFKELFRTIQLIITYTITYNKRDIKKRDINNLGVNLVHFSPMEKIIGDFVLNLFIQLQTLGDYSDFFASNYVSDFEFIYGNYVEPIFNQKEMDSKKGKYNRYEIINYVKNYSDKKYNKLFSNMNSSLRNALVHKLYFIDKDKNKIVFENYRRRKEELDIETLEDLAFKMRIIGYMLTVSNEFLSLSNNLAVKYIKAFFKNFIINPKKFEEEQNSIISLIMLEIKNNPKLANFLLIFKILNKMIFSFVLQKMLDFLYTARIYDVKYITQFVAQFYNIRMLKENTKEELKYLQEMKKSF